MFDTIESVRAYLERVIPTIEGFAAEYGEPGYGSFTPTPYSIIVLGSYWCRCPKFEPNDPNPLHGIERHYPETFKRLESLGVEFQWGDEWIISNEGKAYRTSPDSYSWLPSTVITDGGELLTPDDDITEWVAYAVNEPTRAIPAHVYNGKALIEAGFARFNGEFETGWHPGQDDDPADVVQRIIEQHGSRIDIVFTLDDVGQFDGRWSAYWRRAEGACRTPNCVGDADDVDAEDGFCPDCCETLERVASIIDGTEWSHIYGTVGQQSARVLADRGLIGGVR